MKRHLSKTDGKIYSDAIQNRFKKSNFKSFETPIELDISLQSFLQTAYYAS